MDKLIKKISFSFILGFITTGINANTAPANSCSHALCGTWTSESSAMIENQGIINSQVSITFSNETKLDNDSSYFNCVKTVEFKKSQANIKVPNNLNIKGLCAVNDKDVYLVSNGNAGTNFAKMISSTEMKGIYLDSSKTPMIDMKKLTKK